MAKQFLEPRQPQKRLRDQCSYSVATMNDYDVFLNHRGPDVKDHFIAHLHDALRSVGLNSFLDKKSLVKGEPAFDSIDAALEVAKIHIAVVSRGYAESKYCLRELVSMMRSSKPVIPIFYDVEPAHLRRVENGQFKKAFEKHKLRETTEQVQEWTNALCELANITGVVFCLSNYKGDEAELIQEVVDAIVRFLPLKEALHIYSHLLGLEEQLKICNNELEKMASATSLLCLVGMGGIGKTTLAKAIYNQYVHQNKFQAMSFLEIDHNTPSSFEIGPSLQNRLQKQLLWDLLRIADGDQQRSYMNWFHKLSNIGPILIVLDDIKDKSQFDNLILDRSLIAPGSCIIVTSRDRHLLKVIAGKSSFYLHEITPLGTNDSQKLFNWNAFGNEEAPEDFKALANEVTKACGGLPLALEVVGSSLFDKTSKEDQKYIWPEAIDALKGDPDVMNALKWSYNCLSESEKLMFVDIACIFYGWEKQKALEIWQTCKKCSSCCGNGTPYTSLRHLIDKSLIVLEDNIRIGHYVLAMHGLLRDMGQAIGEDNGSHLWKGKATKAMQDKNQELSKVRTLDLANSRKHNFDAENFAKMQNLHFLILDGCDVSGNLGSISKELRYLQWRYMPLTHLPPWLNLTNLMSLDFSESTKLANIWGESNPALEACPNLLRLKLKNCTSITTLPNSIGRLSRLQVLNLNSCKNLQMLPSSIGQLTALEELCLGWCRSLKALPNSITALSGLQRLYLNECSSFSNLPASIGLMTSLTILQMNLTTEWQALSIGQLNALTELEICECTDEVINVLDRSSTLTNLHQLSLLMFVGGASITKLPETIGLLTNLDFLELTICEKVQKLPNSIGQLKLLRNLFLFKCNSLKTLPDSMGTLTSLQLLGIVECKSIINLPSSIGHLPSLHQLRLEGCSELQSLPKSLKQLNKLQILEIYNCGRNLESLGVLRVLQGLCIWGCTSITRLSGSCLMVVDSNFWNPTKIWVRGGWSWVHRNIKDLQVVEVNDCGFLRHVQEDTESGKLILQRVYNLPCCKLTQMYV